MKNNIVIQILLFVVLMLVYQCADAQDYVLTTRGDSLTGEVKPLLYGTEKRVQLIGEDEEKSTFSLFEVRAFSHEGDIYHPVKGDNGYVFMKLLQPGYLSLYAYQPENQTRFDGLFLKKLDGERMAMPNLGFKKYLSKFLEDCPDVSESVKAGDYSKKNLTEVIAAYNACVESRTVNHGEAIAVREQQSAKLGAWANLDKEVREKEFSEKQNAIEMIAEIRKKIRSEESIPNFLVEGLKNALKDTGLTDDLDQALAEIR